MRITEEKYHQLNHHIVKLLGENAARKAQVKALRRVRKAAANKEK